MPLLLAFILCFSDDGLALVSCDFEDFNFCGWSNDAYNNFNWSLGSGQTPDRTSGPRVDHTFGGKPTTLLFLAGIDDCSRSGY